MKTLIEQIRILTNPDEPGNPVMQAFRIGREQAEAGWREAQKTFALGKLAVVEKLLEDAKAAKEKAEVAYKTHQPIYRKCRWKAAEAQAVAWRAQFSNAGDESEATRQWGAAIDAEEEARREIVRLERELNQASEALTRISITWCELCRLAGKDVGRKKFD